MKVVKEFPYSRIRSFTDLNPYTICFVYTQNEPKGFVVKGGVNDVNEFLKSTNESRMEFRTFWYHGKSRGHVQFENFTVDFICWDFDKKIKHIKYRHPTEGRKILKSVKRIPRRWMKELDQFVKH